MKVPYFKGDISMLCIKCGEQLSDNAHFCNNCGAPINGIPTKESIEFIPIKCPNCGGKINFPEGEKFTTCQYCGYEIKINDPGILDVNFNIKENANKLLELGTISEKGKNFEQAYNYFLRATEAEPNNSLAWLGKARCCILSSLDEKIHLEEAKACIDKARELSITDHQAEILTSRSLINEVFQLVNICCHNIDVDFQRNAWPLDNTGHSLAAGVILFGPSLIQRQNLKSQLKEYFVQEQLPGIIYWCQYAWNWVKDEETAIEIYKVAYRIIGPQKPKCFDKNDPLVLSYFESLFSTIRLSFPQIQKEYF